MNMKSLLASSIELASVKTRKQLSQFLDNRLKDILLFDHSTIFLLNRNKGLANDFLFDPETGIREIPFCQCIGEKMGPEEKRLIFDEISETRHVLPYLKDRRSTYKGLRLNLDSGNSAIGHWVLLYAADMVLEADRGDRDLLYFLASQLSIVVSKILADEMVLEREMENEIT